uniref:Uncharacterized protein AlNc14C437G11634 n=1 Tax=Albugo laibachii Nc14 TaxID=890382 RepID=F0WZP3_9STRA|nr:conserved hypothetical protein [Albugo laibachii Nc14]|eukprot:CCA26969.1 conserved hypothetical protein [Albugo laibachii Nc14]
MLPWKENVHLPLFIDIFYDGTDQNRIHLERWSVRYRETIPNKATNHGNTSLNEDVLKVLREVCKKAAILLRALYSLMRQLPLHQLHFVSYPPCLSYQLHSIDNTDQLISKSDAIQHGSFGKTETVREYAFLPISTPFGSLEVKGLYRIDIVESLIALKDLTSSPKLIFQPDVIIQDYVSPSGMSSRMQQSQGSIRSRSHTSDEKMDSINNTVQNEEQVHPPSSRQVLDRRRLSSDSLTPDSPRRSLQKITSQPMAIPVRNGVGGNLEFQNLSSPSHSRMVGGKPENALKSVTGTPTHPHSFDECNRYQESNINIVAAPFGYKNVPIYVPHTSIASSESSGNSGNIHWNSSGTNVIGTKEAPQPRSTPPIHPSSLTGSRHVRRRTFTPSLDAVGGALENFSLDSGLHVSPNYTLLNSSSKISPSSARPADHVRVLTEKKEIMRQEADESRRSANSTMTTPPFSYLDSSSAANNSNSCDAAPPIVRSCENDCMDSTGTTQKSPPFQANPCELYTTPGFTYRSHDQAFVARTDHYQTHRREVNLESLALKEQHISKHTQHSVIRVNCRNRRFGTDALDQQTFSWGISSPDSADAFHLLLPLTREEKERSSETFQANATLPYEAEDHDFPFAINDTESFMSKEKSTEKNGAFNLDKECQHASTIEANDTKLDTIMLRTSASEAEWKTTVSVSKFLHHLNHAPNLEMCIVTGQEREAVLPLKQALETASQQSDNVAVGDLETDKTSGITDVFDEELNSFRKLRDELTSQLGYDRNSSEISRLMK